MFPDSVHPSFPTTLQQIPHRRVSTITTLYLVHTTTGCGEQGFPSAQPYLSHTPGG
ncbi:hypothetical protein BO94DRAFT_293973 [Aspergillus sclerotioniger CBS 115572]|uniref:Uncharacterized protein n=1 Tax=Aspergillus sclerotioniger CBS 115572 TaxID=1450535 RepID=A0A317V8J4_9EURO|nr:hypothetical protein BO94DRAFT_293973 [Aspergillus sclerotioniger CBS 115572]PWY69621.1 hypothetical protein BO94DRAFT_293973 [Aspergillus sclerotioniger CBS 115572]